MPPCRPRAPSRIQARGFGRLVILNELDHLPSTQPGGQLLFHRPSKNHGVAERAWPIRRRRGWCRGRCRVNRPRNREARFAALNQAARPAASSHSPVARLVRTQLQRLGYRSRCMMQAEEQSGAALRSRQERRRRYVESIANPSWAKWRLIAGAAMDNGIFEHRLLRRKFAAAPGAS